MHSQTYHYSNVAKLLLLCLPVISTLADPGYRERLMWMRDGYVGGGTLLEPARFATRIQCSTACLERSDCAAHNSYIDEETGKMICEQRGLNHAPLTPQVGAFYTYDVYFGMTFDPELGNWYSAVPEPIASYWDAEAICRSRGLHVMAVKSQAEQDKLGILLPSDNTWVGLHRPAGGATNDIRYTNDNTTIGSFNYFVSSQPDSFPAGADCIIVYHLQGHQWYDAPCRSTIRYICQL